jgi:hypothetical protein
VPSGHLHLVDELDQFSDWRLETLAPSHLQVVGGILLFAGLFALTEAASGAS